MKIIIENQGGKVKTSLIEAGEKLGSFRLVNREDISEKMLEKIDKMLKKANIGPEKIQKVEFLSDQDKNYTTTRIIEAISRAWNWSAKGEKRK